MLWEETVSVITALAINGDRLNHSIDALAEIGKLPGGGVRRLAFSLEDVQARLFIREWMLLAGMEVRVDAAGNLIGTYAGTEVLPSLATGSHIDTVPAGGRYDGTLGVLAGIEVVRTLQERDLRLRHPLEVMVFADEEGGMIGCKAMAGTVAADPDVFRHRDGTHIAACLERVGGNWSQLSTARRTRADMAAFVELHVEQGGVLEALDKQIGVVEGVVGMFRGIIAVEGRANHAGTTPMSARQDALVAAAQIVLAVNDLGRHPPGDQVATVGVLNVFPNAPNIVPGRVELGFGIRDLSQSKVEAMVDELQQRLQAIAASTHTRIQLTPKLEVKPALATPNIQAAIAAVSEEIGLSYHFLPSRAGHDAMEMGRFTDMGMIFIPSAAGISHAVDEYSSPEACVQGTNVLLHTLLKLDAEYDSFPS